MAIKNLTGYMLFILISLCLLISCGDSVSSGDSNETKMRALPQLSINLEGEEIINEPKVPARLKVTEQDSVTYTGTIGIEYRGSTSFYLFDKKSYGIETWDDNLNDIDIGLLGFLPEEDWILYGPYSDKTLIRNVLVYNLARKMGRYAPRTKFVELNIDGQYQGVYVFMEKIKRDENRLDLTDLDPDENSSETITGGYLLKIDKTAGEPGGDASYTEFLGFRSNFNVYGENITYEPYGEKQGEETYFLYEDPAPEDITNEQKEYIQNYIHNFEATLLNDLKGSEKNLTHSAKRDSTYTDFINLDSFVDFFLINELAHNADAYRLSSFLHKDRGAKLKMGPVWDFNLSLGNDENEFRRSAETWIYKYNQNIPNDLWLVPFWWPLMVNDPQFRNSAKDRWQELRSGVWNDSELDKLITEFTTKLKDDGAVQRNFGRWDVIGEHIFGNGFVGQTYQEEVEYLRDWLDERLTWMDNRISDW